MKQTWNDQAVDSIGKPAKWQSCWIRFPSVFTSLRSSIRTLCSNCSFSWGGGVTTEELKSCQLTMVGSPPLASQIRPTAKGGSAPIICNSSNPLNRLWTRRPKNRENPTQIHPHLDPASSSVSSMLQACKICSKPRKSCCIPSWKHPKTSFTWPCHSLLVRLPKKARTGHLLGPHPARCPSSLADLKSQPMVFNLLYIIIICI